MNVSKEKSSIQSEYVRRGQRKAAASSRADRSFRIKPRPDTEKDSEYTSMFVRKKRPLHAAFASPRRSAKKIQRPLIGCAQPENSRSVPRRSAFLRRRIVEPRPDLEKI